VRSKTLCHADRARRPKAKARQLHLLGATLPSPGGGGPGSAKLAAGTIGAGQGRVARLPGPAPMADQRQPVISRITPWPVTLCCTLTKKRVPVASKMPPVHSAFRSFSVAIRTQPSERVSASSPSSRHDHRSLFRPTSGPSPVLVDDPVPSTGLDGGGRTTPQPMKSMIAGITVLGASSISQ